MNLIPLGDVLFLRISFPKSICETRTLVQSSHAGTRMLLTVSSVGHCSRLFY